MDGVVGKDGKLSTDLGQLLWATGTRLGEGEDVEVVSAEGRSRQRGLQRSFGWSIRRKILFRRYKWTR